MHQQGSAAVSHTLVLPNVQNIGIGPGADGSLWLYPQGTVKAEVGG